VDIKDPKVHLRRRIKWALGFVIGAWLILLGRFFQIQVLHSSYYRQYIPILSQKKLILEAKRGTIYDRNHHILAFDMRFYSFAAEPPIQTDPAKIALVLSEVIGGDYSSFLEKLQRPSGFVWLARGVPASVAERIRLEPGERKVYAVPEEHRSYPFDHVAGQVLGFTDIDNVGRSGIEYTYEALLRGEPGFKIIQQDALANPRPSLELPEKKPVDGKSLILTLDLKYQMIAEEELERGVREVGAKGGIVIMVQPRTGEVLAMACDARFNPNEPGRYPLSAQRNRAITDCFEPGSTFKIVAAAAALEEGVQSPEDLIFCENGRLTVPGGEIQDYKPFGWLTFQRVFEKSSNVGMAKVAGKLSAQTLYRYARDFGFGTLTGIDLPGEAPGTLHKPSKWTGGGVYRVALGYGLSVTALQLTMAYAAVANEGWLMKPLTVKAIQSPDGKTLRQIEPQVVRRVISEKTARTLRRFLIGVVERGTGREARLEGIQVAGKTGTARKYLPEEGRYSEEKYIASFVGFLPADNPQLVCTVVIDEPRKGYYGGEVAAPIFNRIVRRILDSIQPPRVASRSLNSPGNGTNGHGDHRSNGHNGNGSAFRIPSAPPARKPGSAKVLPSAKATVEVPNVVGLPMREAVHKLLQRGLKMQINGSGWVVRQHPAPGQRVEPGQVCVIEAKPRRR